MAKNLPNLSAHSHILENVGMSLSGICYDSGMREIEVKIRTDNLRLVQERLEGKGCQFSEPVHQHDTIYTIADEDIWTAAKEGDISMRIRQQDDGSVFNLKQQKTS
jgi:adenylate cyclase class 2